MGVVRRRGCQRRPLAIVAAVALTVLVQPAGAAGLAPPRDWALGGASGSVTDPFSTRTFSVSMEISSGPAGESPGGAFTAREAIVGTGPFPDAGSRWTLTPTCLSVSGSTAIIGFTGRFVAEGGGVVFNDDPVAGLARVNGPAGSASDTFEWAYTQGSLGQPNLPGPTTCGSFPGSFPPHPTLALTSIDFTVLDNGSLPQTTITSGPAEQAVIADPTPTFEFSSDDPQATFECSIGGGFAACQSPLTLGPLSEDDYAFRVRAIGSNGAVDPSPAVRSFQVSRPQCLGRQATVLGTPGSPATVGTTGDDVIVTEGGDDVILGLGGNDLICAGGGTDQVYAGAGDDVIRGEDGDDTLQGGPGNDFLLGDGGNDYMRGADGNDAMLGGDGNDAALAGTGADIVVGQAGNDALFGGAGPDVLVGQTDDDVLVGGADADLLSGDEGNDTLDGGTGANQCDGGPGTNVLTSCS